MNRAQINVTKDVDDDQFNLAEAMIVLARHKKLILQVTAAAVIVSSAVSMVLPNIYTASTKLLPPQQANSGAAALLSQLGGFAGIAAGAAGLKNPSDVYVGMLKSRTIADRLIARFDLQKTYNTPLLQDTRKALEENTSVLSGKDGLITIEVDDEDSKRAAQLANAYVEELVSLNQNLAVTEASQRRLFFQRQLEQTKNKLAESEVALKGALDDHGVISVDVESRAIIETVGRIKAQVSAKEIELNSMRAFVTSTNPEFRRVEQELASLRNELSKLENGRGGAIDSKPDESKKNTGLANIKLLRDVKYYQMLYEIIAKQYEVARLDEAKEASIVQVLDSAVEPEKKSKPRRLLIVILAGLLGLIAGAGWAFLREARQKTGSKPNQSTQLDEPATLMPLK